jgi:hypothetical protein
MPLCTCRYGENGSHGIGLIRRGYFARRQDLLSFLSIDQITSVLVSARLGVPDHTSRTRITLIEAYNGC